MLIRILGPVEVESKPGFTQQFSAGEFVDIGAGVAREAIAQGAAVPSTMAEYLASIEVPAPVEPNPESEPEALKPRTKAQKPKKEN